MSASQGLLTYGQPPLFAIVLVGSTRIEFDHIRRNAALLRLDQLKSWADSQLGGDYPPKYGREPELARAIQEIWAKMEMIDHEQLEGFVDYCIEVCPELRLPKRADYPL